MRSKHVLFALLIGTTSLAFAQTGGSPAAQHTLVTPETVKWEPAPPSLPPGGQIAVLDGDPSKPGEMFMFLAKLPDGYVVAPHWHPTDEHVTILKGTMHFGFGEKFNKTYAHKMPAGAYMKTPAKMAHYVWVEGETIFQVTAKGPFELNYINPADDPRTKKTPSSR